MEYTKEQQDAINVSGRNLLISAAAGSGKTAVLVERIIRRILDDKVDIDRMLVMTFTKAAADQMRDKLLKAIEDKRRDNPFDPWLQKQAALVHNASITTIHGFCKDILQNHFSEINLSPDFRVADEGEVKLIEQDTLRELLEEEYTVADDAFIKMTEVFATGKNDKKVEEIILKLYSYAMSYPNPEKWLDDCVKPYVEAEDGSFDNSEYSKLIEKRIRRRLKEAKEVMLEAKEICERPMGPKAYLNNVNSDINILEGLLECRNLHDFWKKYEIGIEFSRLASIKKADAAEVDDELKEAAKEKRDIYKKMVTGIKDKYFTTTYDATIQNMVKAREDVEEIVRITKKFIDRFSEVKRDNNICDFNDLEHLSLEVLGIDEPSSVSLDYKNYFKEIFIDEYQDSNAVQEQLLDRVSNGHNLFMVGDVKQSIYKFRLAKPNIFLDKYDSYERYRQIEEAKVETESESEPASENISESNAKTESESENNNGYRIDLRHNYRSRATVLESVNEVFERVMTSDSGELDYDEAARLVPGAKDYLSGEEYKLNNRTELILIQRDEEVPEKELEARAIARKIISLRENHMIFDRETGTFRKPVFSDFCILLRATKGAEDIFKAIFLEEGIPVDSESRVGYFDAYEVSLLMDLLRVIDNPRQDIPLMAVLTSPFADFSEEELALLKIEYREKSDRKRPDLYDIVSEMSDNNEKAKRFLEFLNSIRDEAGYTPVYDILRQLIDGFYGNYVASLPSGKRRAANLNMLLKKAQDYGKISYKGLFNFVRYIDALRKYEVDFGEANVIDDADDTVKIMSIHKSKGLEFPVCFVAGMQKNYNYMDARGAMLPDVDLGVGIDYVDLSKRTKTPTLAKIVIADKITCETYEEEMRILYVAMTRAKEKLILTATVDDPETIDKPSVLSACNSYMALLAYAKKNRSFDEIDISALTVRDIIDEAVKTEGRSIRLYEELRDILEGRSSRNLNSDFIKDIKGRIDFTYIPPKPTIDNMKKISVTELKKKAMQENRDDTSDGVNISVDYHSDEERIPAFLREEADRVPAAVHGTAVHRIFEIWDYSREVSRESVREFLEENLNNGRVEPEMVESVTVKEIMAFLTSGIARRMGEADRNGLLFREQPFVIEMDEYLVQGIIDAYFLENDKIVIVDYKTDKAARPEELAEKYRAQLVYYARALKRLLNREISELIIFSTRLKTEIKLEKSTELM